MRLRFILSYAITVLHLTSVVLYYQFYHLMDNDNEYLFGLWYYALPMFLVSFLLFLSLNSPEKQVQQFIYTEVAFLFILGLVYVLNDMDWKYDNICYLTSNEFLITVMCFLGILFNTFSFIQSWKILR